MGLQRAGVGGVRVLVTLLEAHRVAMTVTPCNWVPGCERVSHIQALVEAVFRPADSPQSMISRCASRFGHVRVSVHASGRPGRFPRKKAPAKGVLDTPVLVYSLSRGDRAALGPEDASATEATSDLLVVTIRVEVGGREAVEDAGGSVEGDLEEGRAQEELREALRGSMSPLGLVWASMARDGSSTTSTAPRATDQPEWFYQDEVLMAAAKSKKKRQPEPLSLGAYACTTGATLRRVERADPAGAWLLLRADAKAPGIDSYRSWVIGALGLPLARELR